MSSKSSRNNRPQSAGGQRSGHNRTQGTTGAAGPTPGFRPWLERTSAPALVTLHTMPKWLVPVLLAFSLFFGLLLSGDWAWLGAILLALVAVFVGWLSLLSWPVLTPGARLARVIVTVALFGIAVLKAMGRM